MSPTSITGLANGTTYYFIVTAVNAGGESSASAQSSAVPQVPVAEAPSGVAAASGDTQVTLTWNSVSGAASYNIYYSTASGVTAASGTRIAGATSPTTITGLTNGTTYYFIVTAVNPGGESSASAQALAVPQVTAAGAPTGVAAASGDTQVTLTWNPVSGAGSYNIYYSTASGVTAASGTKVAGATSPTTITGLTNGTTYYFIVTAVNPGGESSASAQALAVPQVTVAGAPTGVAAASGDTQVTLTWNPVSGAGSYNIYYSTASGVTAASGTKVAGATSPTTITGLTNGTTYYFIVTAVNPGGESSASAQSPATPQVPSPSNPTGVGATAGNGQAVVSWSPVPGAASYNLYYSTVSSFAKGSGTKVTGVTSPRTVTGLTNGTTCYFIVTAVNAGGESSGSLPASATPQLPALEAPALRYAWSGDGLATLTFYTVSGAASYNLYYAPTAGVTTATGTKISGLSSIYQYSVGLSNGTTYYFIATAKNAAGESPASPAVAVTPQPSLAWVKKTTPAVYKTWIASASSADGSKLVACNASGYIYTSGDGGVTWTSRSSAGSRNWRAIASSDDGTKLAACVASGHVYTSTDSGVTWTDRDGAGTASWASIASSSDGSRLALVGSNPNCVATSTDGGATWTDRSAVTGSRSWNGIASSSDGLRLAACVFGGNIFTSFDGGASWTARSPDGYSKSWAKISSSADGTKIAAVDFSSLWISLDSGSTWARASGSDWKNAVYNAEGTRLYAYASGFVNVSSDNGATWTALTNSGSTHSWSSLSVSSDGTKLFAPCSSGMDDLYTSSDSGATWIDRTPGYRGWDSVAMSSDGTKLAACGNNSDIFTSSDSGTTWIDRNSGSRQWTSLAGSTDGSKLVAAVSSGYLYTSADSGLTWTERTSAGSRSWGHCASSADGTKLAACVSYGDIYTSADGGQSWTDRPFANSPCWAGIASSADGTRLVAVVGNGSNSPGDVYTSADGGETWTDRVSAGTRAWLSVCSSSDGMSLAASAYGGLIYTSTDGGVTWTGQPSTGTVTWYDLSSSSDGKKLVALDNQYMYTSVDGGQSWMKQTNSGPRLWGCTIISPDGSRIFSGESSFGDLWMAQ